MNDTLKPIHEAIQAGDKIAARQLIRDVLKQSPSADAWVLAAQLATSKEQAITCLKKALELQPLHTQANRLLYKLEGAKPLDELKPPPSEWQKDVGVKPLSEIKRQKKQDIYQQQAARNRGRFRFGCMMYLLMMCSISYFVFRAVGLSTPIVTTLNQNLSAITGGATPVMSLYGTPLAYFSAEQAAILMTPVAINEAAQVAEGNLGLMLEKMQVLDHGYLHEHTFNARKGDYMAVYVQFLSFTASQVPNNVTLLDPNGYNRVTSCEQSRILDDNSNLALVCPIDVTGVWKIQVIGVDGESVGAYFVGAERLQN